MTHAEHIVERLLETGEGDPDYQDDQLDAIVQELAKNGFPDAYYKEFDTYQGVYLRVPGVDKFWMKDWARHKIRFYGEEAVEIGAERGDADADTRAGVVTFYNDKPDISDLLRYIQHYHGVKLANKAVHQSAVKFMQERLR